jgi:hypothetical protein
LPACIEKRLRILLPRRLVKVGRQKEARFFKEHGIHAHDEIAAIIILAGEMAANHVVCDRNELSMWTFRALDSRLFADTANPLVGANRRIAGLPRLFALESPGIYILASAKQRPE